jgi:glutaredoxin
MIVLNFLYGCPYCKNAEKMLQMYNIPYTKNNVTSKTKDAYKKKYKMDTFPQVFYKSSKLHKIGGSDELNALIHVCKILKKYNFNQPSISYFKQFV